MDHKLSDIPLQPLKKSSEVEDENAIAHDHAELVEASKGDQEQKKKQNWLKRCVSQKGKSIFIAVTTMLGYLLLNLAISVIAPFYSIWALQKGANLIISGLVIGMAGLSVSIFSPILGVCLPNLGVKFSQVAGLFLAGGSFILFGFVTDMPSGAVFIAFSFILRAVEGLGTAMYSTASYTLLAQLFSEHKGMVVAISQVSIVTGFIVGAPVGGLLQSVGGFKLPFVSVGAIIMVLVLVLFLQQLGLAKSENPGVVLPKVLCRLFKFPMVTLLVVMMVLQMTTIGAVISTLGRFLHAELRLGVDVIGAIYLPLGVPYIISSIVVGKLTDKLNPRYLEIIGVLGFGTALFFAGPPTFISEPKLWVYVVVLPFVGISDALVSVPPFTDIYNTASAVELTKDKEGKENMHYNGFAYREAMAIREVKCIVNTEVVVLKARRNISSLAGINTQRSHDEVLAGAISGILVATIALGDFLGPALGGVLVYFVGYQWMMIIFSGLQLFLGLVLIVATLIERLCRRAAARSLHPDETQVVTLKTEF